MTMQLYKVLYSNHHYSILRCNRRTSRKPTISTSYINHACSIDNYLFYVCLFFDICKHSKVRSSGGSLHAVNYGKGSGLNNLIVDFPYRGLIHNSSVMNITTRMTNAHVAVLIVVLQRCQYVSCIIQID